MKTYFSLALLQAAASAASFPPSAKAQAQFVGFSAEFNKHYSTVEEMADRISIFQSNSGIVEAMNENNNGVSFRINASGDMTEQEFHKQQGVNMPDHEHGNGRHLSHDEGQGRRLQSSDLSINWVELGKVGDVKSQGGCGSCWAFAATTAQEAMQAIKNDTTPVRLSEQEGVDCTTQSSGCNGGWMSHYWNFSSASGSQLDEAYPYQAQTLECRHQEGKVVASRADTSSVGYMRGTVTEAMEQLQNGPMTIAVSAGNSCWRWYEAGVLSAANECPTSIDHGVVVVGVHLASGNPTPPEPEYERTCRKALRSEKRADPPTCDGEGEIMEPNRKGVPNRKCCTYTLIENVSEVSEDSMDYWIVQNSWGNGWGQNGFVHLAVEDGAGVSGMNQYMQYMQVQDGGDSTPPTPATRDCTIDEATNTLGPNRCSSNSECSGDRTCSVHQWCQGTSNC